MLAIVKAASAGPPDPLLHAREDASRTDENASAMGTQDAQDDHEQGEAADTPARDALTNDSKDELRALEMRSTPMPNPPKILRVLTLQRHPPTTRTKTANSRAPCRPSAMH